MNGILKRVLHFIHLNISSFLSKVEELWLNAKSTNATIEDICEFKHDTSALKQEISIDN